MYISSSYESRVHPAAQEGMHCRQTKGYFTYVKQKLGKSNWNMQFFLSNLETLVRHDPLKEILLWLNSTATLQGRKSMALEGADNWWEQQNQASTLP